MCVMYAPFAPLAFGYRNMNYEHPTDQLQNARSYVPLSSRIQLYSGSYSASAIAVYVHLVARASWAPGPENGTIRTSIREMSQFLHMAPQTIRRSVNELQRGYPFGILSKNRRVAPPLIEIVETTGKTKKKRHLIRILKLNLMMGYDQSQNHIDWAKASNLAELDLSRIHQEVRNELRDLFNLVANGVDPKLFGK